MFPKPPGKASQGKGAPRKSALAPVTEGVGATQNKISRRKRPSDALHQRKLEKRKQKQLQKRVEASGCTYIEQAEFERRKEQNIAAEEYLKTSQDVTIAQRAFVLIKNIKADKPPLHTEESVLMKMIDHVDKDKVLRKPKTTLPPYLQPERYVHKASLRASLILNDFKISRDLPLPVARAGWLWGFQHHRSFDVYWTTVRFYCIAFTMMEAAGMPLSALQVAYIDAVHEASDVSSNSFVDRNAFIKLWHQSTDPKDDILPLSKVQTYRAKAFLDHLVKEGVKSKDRTAAEAARMLRVVGLTADDPSSLPSRREAKAMEDLRERSKIYLAEQRLATDDDEGVTTVDDAQYEELCKDKDGDRYMPDEWLALLPAKKVKFFFHQLVRPRPVALEQKEFMDDVPEDVKLVELKMARELGDVEFGNMLQTMEIMSLDHEPMELCSDE